MDIVNVQPPSDAIEAWHWLAESGCTANESPVRVEAGQTLHVDPPLEICCRGLHASRDILDALQYAPGPILCRVRLWGATQEQSDKLCAEYRHCDWLVDATPALRRWARWCALRVAHLWSPPAVVLQYLRTGDESSRSAAESAARSAAESAAESAARSAAWGTARSAAWDAAWDAAWGAARGTARSAAWDAAWGAAWGAARDAARDAQRAELLRLVEMLRTGQEIPQTIGFDEIPALAGEVE